MPTLSYQIPNSDWAVLKEEADREGVSVRELVKWRIRQVFALPERTLKPTPPAATSEAAA